MDYSYAIEKRDYKRIDKLNQLNNSKTFWNDLRKLTKQVKSDHGISRWVCLAEVRFKELTNN